ncbi:MAG: hypothetical protein WAU88_07045, partial [Candidatus Zixiibacteriota bacterium]
WCMMTIGSDLYVGTAGGVWVSSNKGTNWTSFSTGLPDSILVNKLTTDGQYMYAGTGNLSIWRRSLAPSCCTGTTGNINCTGTIDLVDLSTLVKYLTEGGFSLCCPDAANVNRTGVIDLADLSSLLSYLTGGGFVLPNCP